MFKTKFIFKFQTIKFPGNAQIAECIEYCLNDMPHNTNGPAREYFLNGKTQCKEYYLNGQQYTFSEWCEKTEMGTKEF